MTFSDDNFIPNSNLNHLRDEWMDRDFHSQTAQALLNNIGVPPFSVELKITSSQP